MVQHNNASNIRCHGVARGSDSVRVESECSVCLFEFYQLTWPACDSSQVVVVVVCCVVVVCSLVCWLCGVLVCWFVVWFMGVLGCWCVGLLVRFVV